MIMGYLRKSYLYDRKFKYLKFVLIQDSTAQSNEWYFVVADNWDTELWPLCLSI